MEQFIIDTNVISDYLFNAIPHTGELFLDEVINETPILSVITQIELLCWNTNEVVSTKVIAFLKDCSILNISSAIIEQCVLIRKGKKIKTPDAIIAAIALAYNYCLITNNEKDFTNITGLKTINPHKL